MLYITLIKQFSYIAKFLLFSFKGNDEGHKLPQVGWEDVCLLGRDKVFTNFHKLLLGKWLWRLSIEEGSLWHEIMVARFELCGSSVMHAV